MSAPPDHSADEAVVHECPLTGSGLTPCCSLPPFELARNDRMTSDPSLVTCWTGSDPRLREARHG